MVWCCARCLCCGVSCCCECLSCLTCCDSCRGRRKASKYADDRPVFAPYQGYQPAPAPPSYAPSGFATFEAPTNKGRIHEDSLPAMPSWDNASSRRVEDTSENNHMEMDHLASQTGQATGIVPAGARTDRAGYSQIANQPPSPFENGPAQYRGADMTQASGYDLGAQRHATEDTGYRGYAGVAASTQAYPIHQPYYDSPSLGGGEPPSYRTSPPSEYVPSAQAQMNRLSMPNAAAYKSYSTPQSPPTQWSPTDSTRYAPTTVAGSAYVSPTQVRPPSLLQAGRKPVPGSGREV